MAQTETVPASEVMLDDEVFFPNSRRPQKVVQITDSSSQVDVGEEGPWEHRTLISGDARWHLKSDAPVRRLPRDGDSGE